MVDPPSQAERQSRSPEKPRPDRVSAQCGACVVALLVLKLRLGTFVARLAIIRIAPETRSAEDLIRGSRVFFCLKPHRIRDDNALKCYYQHGTKNQAGHSAAHPRQARSRLRIECVPQARYCDGSWPLAKQRHIPLARRFMVAQDIDAAVVDLYFEVTAIGGEPTVDDFHYRDTALSQVKGAGLLFAPVAGVALHSDLHLPMSSGFETTAAFPLDAVQNN